MRLIVACPKCREHGAWFDADELPRILQWIRCGGLAKANEDRAREATHEERLKQIGKPLSGREPLSGASDESADQAGLGTFLADVVLRLLMP
jgi:hypothetical protein